MSENITHGVSKTIDYLNRAFQEVTRGLPLAQRILWENPTDREVEGLQHYKWQKDFAYMMDDIQRGAPYIVPKMVADCNKLIESIKVVRQAVK
jgi:hypothetical protein